MDPLIGFNARSARQLAGKGLESPAVKDATPKQKPNQK
jgi:hypothetical protein